MTIKEGFRADGGDIGTGRLKEIADNPYGDEEKCWLAKRVLTLLDELKAAESRLSEILKPNMLLPVIDGLDEHQLRHVIQTCTESYSLLHGKWEAAEKRVAEVEASHAKLRESMAAIHNTIRLDGVRTSLAAIMGAAKRAHDESAAAAGISIKGK